MPDLEDKNEDQGPFGHLGHTKKREFCEAFVECCDVVEAAKKCGVHRNSHYYWLKVDPEYQEAFDLADQMATQTLEAVAFKRACDQSDTLVIFLLKARNRAKYGDRQTINFDKDSDQELIERARKSKSLRSLVTEGAGPSGPAERD